MAFFREFIEIWVLLFEHSQKIHNRKADLTDIIKYAKSNEDHEPEMVVFTYTVVDPRTMVIEILIKIYFYTPFAVVTVPGMSWLPGLTVDTDIL